MVAARAMDQLGTGWALDARGRFGFNMMAREIAFTESWDDAGDVVDLFAEDLPFRNDRPARFERERVWEGARSEGCVRGR